MSVSVPEKVVRRPKRSLIERLADELNLGCKRDRRLRLAAARYVADVERAASPASTTMNWAFDAWGGGDGGVRAAPGEPGGVRHLRARRAIRELEAALPASIFLLLQDVFVERGSVRAIGMRHGLRPRAVMPAIRTALEALADAYDDCVS